MKVLLAILFALSLPAVALAGWGTDYLIAVSLARAQDKLVLLHFTGSDWCPYCQILDREVLSKPSFQAFADKHFVGVDLDFPNATPQSDALAKQNAALADKYQVQTFPTLLVITPDGKELGREEGYDPGSGPSAVISQLQSFK